MRCHGSGNKYLTIWLGMKNAVSSNGFGIEVAGVKYDA